MVPKLTRVGAQVSQDLTKGAEFEKHTSVPNILAFSWKLNLLALNILQVLRCSGTLGRIKICLKRFDSNQSYCFFCFLFVLNSLLNGILLFHQPNLIALCDIIPEVQQWESPIITHLQAIKRSEGNASQTGKSQPIFQFTSLTLSQTVDKTQPSSFSCPLLLKTSRDHPWLQRWCRWWKLVPKHSSWGWTSQQLF